MPHSEQRPTPDLSMMWLNQIVFLRAVGHSALVFVIATMLVPFQATIVPLYIVVSWFNLQDSYWGLIVPWYASPFVIFALMQFMSAHGAKLHPAGGPG